MIDLAILGLLKDQPLHGYELKKRLGETLGFLWGVSYGSLYPALRRLEREQAIEIDVPATRSPVPPTGSLSGDLAAARIRAMAERIGAGSRRIRKAYRITETGDRLLIELLTADDPTTDDDKAFALKLAFCRHLKPEQRLVLLARRRAELSGRLQRVQTPAPGALRAARAGDRRGIDRYTTALLDHRKTSIQRDLEWLDELIALEERDRTNPPDVLPSPVERSVPNLPEGATA